MTNGCKVAKVPGTTRIVTTGPTVTEIEADIEPGLLVKHRTYSEIQRQGQGC